MAEPQADPRGIGNPGAIDAVVVAADGTHELEVWQTEPWDGSDHQLLLVQEKLYNYLSFVADGDLVRAHAPVRRWRLVLRCAERPSGRMGQLFATAEAEVRKLRGELAIRVDGGVPEP